MSKPLYALLALAFASLIAAAPSSQQTLPIGTLVNVRLLQPLSSGTAKAGELFDVQVIDDVVVDHHVVIEKGASGTGRVVGVERASGKSPGAITIEVSQVRAVDGSMIHLHTYTKHEEKYEYGKAHTATVTGTLLTGPFGLLFHNMVKGKDVTVTTAQTLPAYTSSTVAVSLP